MFLYLDFCPFTVAGFFALRRIFNHWVSLAWLTSASLFFYAWWDPKYLWLIGISILFNFFVGRTLVVTQRRSGLRRAVAAFGVAANLLAIAYFKYGNFIVDNLHPLTGWFSEASNIVLPLGISFFTFTQIAFLVDSYNRKASEPNLLKYTLFVTYFPHLIAGPIIHHKDVMGQMSDTKTSLWNYHRLAVGLTIFIIGLFKKVVIADTLAHYPDHIFDIAAHGGGPGPTASWLAAICYTLQIYFDFSGYSDMAIGLSRLFGIQLPINFNSPYKSQSITEFWRRWHISLSRFLRDYLYFSLGGNRHGRFRRYVNLLVTMILGGIWHGAGWTFVIWGSLHGAYLVCNHAWRGLRRKIQVPVTDIERFLGWGLTFIAVIFAWVFFRATSPGSAWIIVRDMLRPNGPADWARIALGRHPHDDMTNAREVVVYLEALAAMIIACCMPNTSQIMSRFRPGISLYDPPDPSVFKWRLSPIFASFAAVLFFAALALLGRPSEFIYFNF